MKILHTTPREDGYRMPGEFEHHSGCIMIWPEREDSWQYGAVAARKAFVNVASAINKSEPLTMLVSARQYDNARSMLPDDIRLVEMSTDDAWARDCTPTFVKDSNGHMRGIDWYFNAWGGLYDGLYFPWDKDNMVAKKICDLLYTDIYDASDFVLEGGSIHVDGDGTAIVTEACLLSPGRNPHMSREDIESKLKDYLGVDKVIWLKNGIYNDETNEHVDNICAYVRPGVVVLAWTDDVNDPQYEMSKSCYDILTSTTDSKGRRLEVIKLPLPSPIHMTAEECDGLMLFNGKPTRVPGERLAASYVNYYTANGSIVMPRFGDKNDDIARDILQNLYTDREIIQIDARDILIGGGNIHCITCQIPDFIK